MSTQALYLKYRPLTFDQVAGQEPITKTLRNALRQGTVRHAYLLTGPRGTGKTTTARLLAKAVNCKAAPDERPCNACAVCTAINEGRLLDLIEVDAASNRGIDEIRDIREKARFRPNQAEYKVYVLDEAHMLTQEAFNALLKTLEEPPPHVLFVLVTTEPHRIPATIASRCQRFDFKRVRLQALVERLAYICSQEGIRIEPAGLELIARQSAGGMRDAVSLLDQMTSYGDDISLGQVQAVLGTVAGEVAGRVVAALAAQDPAGGLEQINTAVSDGADPRQLGREIVELLRGVLLVQQGAGVRLLSTTAEQAAEIERLATLVPTQRVVQAIRLFNDAATDIRRGGLDSIPQLPLEMALVQSLLGTSAPEPAAPPESRHAGVQAAAALREASGDAALPRPPVRGQSSSEAVVPGLTSPHHSPGTAVRETSLRAEPAAGETPDAQEAAPIELEQVRQKWRPILQAMRQRNQATQAVLASGCKPVEVQGDQVTITVPSKILAEKLRDAQRLAELEQVMSKELGQRCRVRLVVEADHAPGPASTPPRARAGVETRGQGSKPESSGTEGEEDGDGVPDPLTQWAEQRGGKARLVEP